MGAYHQMGHAAINLALDARLHAMYAGVITSPLNEEPSILAKQCAALGTTELIFDPQCFVLGSKKNKFDKWGYVNATAQKLGKSPFSPADWQKLAKSIADECVPLGHSGVCSPVASHKPFSDANLRFDIQIGDTLATHLSGTRVKGLQSAIFPVSTLVGTGRAQTIASVLTTGRLQRLYLVPQWTKSESEIQDVDELSGFIQMVQLLAPARKFIVGFCGPEMILWKAAGAEAAATGKYGNQQRFDIARFGGAASGGVGTTAYYFEESLLTWLRTEDIVRLDALGYPLGLRHDPFLPGIRTMIADLRANPPRYVPRTGRNGKPLLHKNGKPKMRRVGPPEWTSLGWRQWLWWFADAEARLESGASARTMVDTAMRNWQWLRVRHFLPSDKVMDGRWLPVWSTALSAIGL